MIKFLDLFSYWSAVVVAVTFIITWATILLYSIYGNTTFIWHNFFFKLLVGITVTGILLAIASQQAIKKIARKELVEIVKSKEVKQVVVYTSHCASKQSPSFIWLLTQLDNDEPAGSRYRLQEYRMAILANDTIARLRIVRNDIDPTLYHVFYSKYTTTDSNYIGVMKIESSLLGSCK